MKATGIVRRIDELGRLVVPKEIRRIFRIREGDPIEIFTGKEGEIILKKYSPIGELGSFAQQLVDSTAQILNQIICVTDRDQVVAVAGAPKRDFLGKSIHQDLEKAIEHRDGFIAKRGDKDYIKILSNGEDYLGEIVQTILCQGDAIGSVVILTPKEEMTLSDTEMKTASIAARFLGQQMEN